MTDLGVGPVGVAYDFASDDALAIDDVGLGPALGAVEFCNRLVGIADGVEVNPKAFQETAVGARVFVDADGEDGKIGALVMELDERGCLLDTGRALTPPEVEQDDFTAVVGEADGVVAVADSEVGGDFAGLAGVGATIAS